MKELDDRTLRWMRYLASNQADFLTEHRTKPLVIWVDGSRKELRRWAKENGVHKVPLATVSSKHEKWQSLNLDPGVHDTTIVVEQGGKALAVFTNLRNDAAYTRVAESLPTRKQTR